MQFSSFLSNSILIKHSFIQAPNANFHFLAVLIRFMHDSSGLLIIKISAIRPREGRKKINELEFLCVLFILLVCMCKGRLLLLQHIKPRRRTN